MFKSLSLRARLLSCLGGVLLVAASVSAYSLRSIYGFRGHLRDEIEVGSTRLDQARQIAIGLGSMRSSIRGIILFSLTRNTAGFTSAKAAFQSSAVQMREVLQSMDANLSTEDRAAMEAIRLGLDEWVARSPEFVSLCESGKIEEANQFTLQKVSPIMDSIQKSASALGQASRTRHDAAIARVDASIERSTLVTLVLMGVVLLVSAGGFLIVSRLARSLRHAAEAVRSGAMQVLSASNEVASSSQYLAQGSSEQAAASRPPPYGTASILGASDYPLKPFRPLELVARIKTTARVKASARLARPDPTPRWQTPLSLGGLRAGRSQSSEAARRNSPLGAAA